MKKAIQIFLISHFGIVANAQSVTIDPKANTTPVFEIKSTTEGMVMPKMTVAQRNIMAGITAGTQVYCTDCTPYGPYNYDGGSWVAMFQTQTVSPITYTVGQAAQGGIVFWIDPASGGQHGLVASAESSNAPEPWSIDGLVRAEAVGFYGGQYNTEVILKSYVSQSGRSAASWCRAFWPYYNNSIKYGDWYLPSLFELQEIYKNRAVIPNLAPVKYWSSTENWITFAECINFADGVNSAENKSVPLRYIPVRRF